MTILLQDLIGEGEGQNLEFKETLFLNIQTNKKDPSIVKASLKTIAAFLNTKGGTLLIGVSNEGKINGIERDYLSCQEGKQNNDGFELKLRDILGVRLQPRPFDKINIFFKKTPTGTVCHVEVLSSTSEIIHLDNDVYIRDGNRTIKLEGNDLTSWIKARQAGASTLAQSMAISWFMS